MALMFLKMDTVWVRDGIDISELLPLQWNTLLTNRTVSDTNRTKNKYAPHWRRTIIDTMNKDNSMLRFSVLMSVYYKESPEYLRQSLESIFNQTILPNEIVLVEDGELSDELYRTIDTFLTKYSSILKIVKLDVNSGLGVALSVGLSHCSYELVARMDTDDIAKPDRFEKQLEIFHRYPEIDVCSAWIDEFVNDVSSIISVRKLPEHHDDIVHFAKSRNPINHPVVMFKKHAVLAAGGYKHFPLFEDYYLWVRMILNGARFYNIRESLLYFRCSPDMFKRRSGLKYALIEYRFLKYMHNERFISFGQFFKNTITRFPTRLMPNSVRSFLYKHVVR